MEERAVAELVQAFVKIEMLVASPWRPIREPNLSHKISEREINVYRGREGNNKNNLGASREAEVFSKHVNAEVLKHSPTPNFVSFQPRPVHMYHIMVVYVASNVYRRCYILYWRKRFVMFVE